MPKLITISLGWGVQSWTLAAMSALGNLPKVDYAIHSDTTWEREATYEFAEQWTPWLEDHGVTVVTVSDAKAARQIIDNTGRTHAPLYTLNSNGAQGQLRRSCTQRWKIAPLRRFISKVLSKRGIAKSPDVVSSWLGITTEEWKRAKDSDVNYIKNIFPLLDLGMSRQDCKGWLTKSNLPIPPKSACKFCPYHSNQAWAELKQAGGEDWKTAVTVDETIRDKRPGYKSYVNQNRIALVDLVIPEDQGYEQGNLFNLDDAPCDSGYCFL